MILYHASNVEVKHPMLVESNRLLDFGQGFRYIKHVRTEVL